jgi:hypothetical protein
MYHPDEAEKEKQKNRHSKRTIRACESEQAHQKRLRKLKEQRQRQKCNHDDDGKINDSTEEVDDSDKENRSFRNHRSRIRYQSPPRTSETSDKDDDDDDNENENHPIQQQHRHPTSPPLSPSQQQPNNLATSLYLNQLPLNEILKDMRFGDIDPDRMFLFPNIPRPVSYQMYSIAR